MNCCSVHRAFFNSRQRLNKSLQNAQQHVTITVPVPMDVAPCDWCSTFQHNIISSSRVEWTFQPFKRRPVLCLETLAPDTHCDAASQHPRKMQTSTAPLRRPKKLAIFKFYSFSLTHLDFLKMYRDAYAQ